MWYIKNVKNIPTPYYIMSAFSSRTNFGDEYEDFKRILRQLHDIMLNVEDGSPWKITRLVKEQFDTLFPNKDATYDASPKEVLSFFKFFNACLMRARDYALSRDNGDVLIGIYLTDGDEEITRLTFNEWNDIIIVPALEKIQRRIRELGGSPITADFAKFIDFLQIVEPWGTEDIRTNINSFKTAMDDRVMYPNNRKYDEIRAKLEKVLRKIDTIILFENENNNDFIPILQDEIKNIFEEIKILLNLNHTDIGLMGGNRLYTIYMQNKNIYERLKK